MTINGGEVFETSWWEYTFDESGELRRGPFEGAISSPIMRNMATGEECSSRELPIGALYASPRRKGSHADDYPRAGKDGHSIFCVVAGDEGYAGNTAWNIEGRASNCTLPDEPTHRCWVRQGTIGERITVDKNGPTCGAGAGSFFMGPRNCWHGFIRDGKLTP
ncbi:MAG: hypothetical protein V4458_06200 [Pseudomonadota bacterium]